MKVALDHFIWRKWENKGESDYGSVLFFFFPFEDDFTVGVISCL